MPNLVNLCLGGIASSFCHGNSQPVLFSTIFICTSCTLQLCLLSADASYLWTAPVSFLFEPISDLTTSSSCARPGGLYQAKTSQQVLEWIDTVPNDGFVRYTELFNKEVVTMTEPKLIGEFLGPKAYHFIKIPIYRKVVMRLLGNGLLVSEGANHKHQKKAILPAFNIKVIRGLYPLFWTKASEMVAWIRQDIIAKTGTTSHVNMEDWAGRAALDIISQAGFGLDFHAMSNPNSPLVTDYRGAFVPDATTKLHLLLTLLTSPKFVSYFPFKKSKLIKDGVLAVTAVINQLIDERKHEMYMNVDDLECAEKSGHKDVMSVAKHSRAFDYEGLVEQAKTILGAGHETSVGSLNFGIHLLSLPKHAHIQAKLRTEIRSHLPSPTSGIPVSADMLDSLPILEAVSKEILRFYPPAPMIGRVAIVDTDICGLFIPKGTTIKVHPWAINKAKHLWGEHAREFRPERWLEEGGAANGGAETLAFLTFGHGPHGCIGRGFAQGENKALLAALIGSFKFELIPGAALEPNVIFGISARIIGVLR